MAIPGYLHNFDIYPRLTCVGRFLSAMPLLASKGAHRNSFETWVWSLLPMVKRTIDFRSPLIRILVLGAPVTYSLIVALATSGQAAMKSNSVGHTPIEIAAQGSSKFSSPIPFQTVARGSRSGIRGPLQTVARTQSEWEALWQKHASVQSNPPSLPAVDFGNEIIVAVFLGEKPSGGYGIEIIGAEPSDGALIISFNEKGPQPGDIQIQAFTQPFHIVRIANHRTEEVRFRRVS